MSMKITVVGSVSKVFAELSRRWPSLQYGIMSEIGYQGRRALYEGFLQGRVINLVKYPLDVRGYRTVAYFFAPNRKSLKISSYPLNLYKPRSVYQSARSAVEARITLALTGYDARILQKRIAAFDKLVRIVPGHKTYKLR